MIFRFMHLKCREADALMNTCTVKLSECWTIRWTLVGGAAARRYCARVRSALVLVACGDAGIYSCCYSAAMRS